MTEEKRFGFGKNWQQFLQNINEDRLEIAKQSLSDFLGLSDLRNKTFVDIGCGSGLSSWAAYHLGAERLVSFDYDPFSVACCQHLFEVSGKPEIWSVSEGSALDTEFLKSLGSFDIVYSWGVLHHTGKMWDAISNTAAMVNPGGYYYISTYNNKKGFRGAKYWAFIKHLYVTSPRFIQLLLEWIHMANFFQSKLLRFKDPWEIIRNYQSKRGMDWRTDITDWVGGYPYEYASVEEIFHFVKKCRNNFSLINFSGKTNTLGTNSFLFQDNKKSKA